MRRFSLLQTTTFLLAALLVSACHQGSRSRPDQPAIAAGAAMRDVTFFSSALGGAMPYRVFLPKSRDASQKFPVVYLLHGNGGGYRDWSNNSDVSKYAAMGMILVMPEGRGSYYLNAVERPNDKFEDYLTRDLIKDVEGRFPALSGRDHRAIVGVSMGGFAAVKLALSRPDLYSFAGALSPPVDVPERRFTWKRAGQWWEFRRIFGSMGSEERKARDLFVLTEAPNPSAVPYIYLTVGDSEPLREPVERFEQRLTGHKISHDFHRMPGGHDWGEWNAQIPGCFAELARRLGFHSPTNGLPAALPSGGLRR